jgi:hypothetical protein
MAITWLSPLLMKLFMELVFKKQLYRWSWAKWSEVLVKWSEVHGEVKCSWSCSWSCTKRALFIKTTSMQYKSNIFWCAVRTRPRQPRPRAWIWICRTWCWCVQATKGQIRAPILPVPRPSTRAAVSQSVSFQGSSPKHQTWNSGTSSSQATEQAFVATVTCVVLQLSITRVVWFLASSMVFRHVRLGNVRW